MRASLPTVLALSVTAACSLPAATESDVPSPFRSGGASASGSPSATPQLTPLARASPSSSPVSAIARGQLAWVVLARGAEPVTLYVKGVRLRDLETGRERDILQGEWEGRAGLSWNADGTRLLVYIGLTRTTAPNAITGRGYEALILDTASGAVVKLASASSDSEGSFDAKWLPDGNLIANTRSGATRFLVVMRPDGVVVRTLYRVGDPPAAGVRSIDSFDPSPDGARVAFGVSGGGQVPQILVVETDGGAPKTLATFTEAEFPGVSAVPLPFSSLRWSPDGGRIGLVFAAQRTFTSLALCIVEAKDGVRSCRTDMMWSAGGYEWLPDSKQMAVETGDRNGTMSIVGFDPTSGSRSVMLTGQRLSIRGTSPDREWLLVMQAEPPTTARLYPFRVATLTLAGEPIWHTTDGLTGQAAWGPPHR